MLLDVKGVVCEGRNVGRLSQSVWFVVAIVIIIQ